MNHTDCLIAVVPVRGWIYQAASESQFLKFMFETGSWWGSETLRWGPVMARWLNISKTTVVVRGIQWWVHAKSALRKSNWWTGNRLMGTQGSLNWIINCPYTKTSLNWTSSTPYTINIRSHLFCHTTDAFVNNCCFLYAVHVLSCFCYICSYLFAVYLYCAFCRPNDSIARIQHLSKYCFQSNANCMKCLVACVLLALSLLLFLHPVYFLTALL